MTLQQNLEDFFDSIHCRYDNITDQQLKTFMNNADFPSFEFHLYSVGTDPHSVPATTLASLLENAQRTMYLLGIARDNRSALIKKFPVEHERKYQLNCKIPKEGSYAMSATLGENATQQLFNIEDIQSVGVWFSDIAHDLSNGSVQALQRLLPDSVLRKRVFESYRKMMPKSGSGTRIEIYSNVASAGPITFTDTLFAKLKDKFYARPDVQMTTITGQLQRIDFAERKVTIDYRPNHRLLECIYEDGVEELLIENRRDLIQVTGNVYYDAEGIPSKITDVQSIVNLDLSPMNIISIAIDNYTVQFKPPISLEPILDDTQQLMIATDEILNIHAYAHTRDELARELDDQIRMLWVEYATEQDEKLTPDSKALKQAILSRAMTMKGGQ